MSAETSEWLNLVFRWVHVVAGVMWIGLLYFFNFINGPVAATFDGDTKKKVVPELLPRALYWFRWGAAFTWVTGILLLGIVYYMGGVLVEPESGVSVGMGTGLGLGLLVVAWVVYDLLWKTLAAKESVGALVSFVLVVVVTFVLDMYLSGRAVYIHVGALFGTIMASNVWMRIWPNQRRIIKATVDGQAPDAAWASTAKLRSKHNTYMSVPLIFTMVSNHFPVATYGHAQGPAILAVIIAVGWASVWWLYKKSTTAAPKAY